MTTKAPAKWREYFTAKLGCVYDDGGNQYIQYKKTRRWVYYGQSGRIKYYHRLGRVEDEGKYDEAREYHIQLVESGGDSVNVLLIAGTISPLRCALYNSLPYSQGTFRLFKEETTNLIIALSCSWFLSPLFRNAHLNSSAISFFFHIN